MDRDASSLRGYVKGDNGTFIIDLEDDDRWSVKQLFGGGASIQGSEYVRDTAGHMGWKTRNEAVDVARGHAGLAPLRVLDPLPDRRGLVAHSRALHE